MDFDELRVAVARAEREVFRLEVQQSYAGVADPAGRLGRLAGRCRGAVWRTTGGSQNSLPTLLPDGAGIVSWWLIAC
ncbi:MAG: hypothetical protein ACRDU4_00515 [Mycobacterium sp.]